MWTAYLQGQARNYLTRNASIATQTNVYHGLNIARLFRHGADTYTSVQVKKSMGKKLTLAQFLFPNRSTAYTLAREAKGGADLTAAQKMGIFLAPRRYSALQLAKKEAGKGAAPTGFRKALAFVFPSTHNAITSTKLAK